MFGSALKIPDNQVIMNLNFSRFSLGLAYLCYHFLHTIVESLSLPLSHYHGIRSSEIYSYTKIQFDLYVLSAVKVAFVRLVH